MKISKLVIISLLFLLVQQGFAQTKLAGGFDHIIDVAQIPWYGKGYLTITDAHLIYQPDKKDYYYNLTFDYVEKDDNNSLGLEDIILEVDGVSAKGWTPADFYKAVEDKDVISLTVKDHNKICEYQIRPLFDLPDELRIFGDSFNKALLNDDTKSNKQKRQAEFNRVGISGEYRFDKDFDFSNIQSYDYLINSDDPLLDKEILEAIEFNYYWKRDEGAPDILITIAKSADESITSTYVPPTSRTVNTGSTTRAQYNYVTGKYDYITTQKNKTIREGGYVNETKTADIYLEISALDTKRLNDPTTVSPPIVLQTIMKWHVTNYNFNVNEQLKKLATWVYSPLTDLWINWWDKEIIAPLGVVCSESSPDVIQSIKKDSKADKLGLKPGDKLLKAKWTTMWFGKKTRHKTSLWDKIPDDETIKLTVSRDGNKMDFDLKPVSIKVYHHYISNKD